MPYLDPANRALPYQSDSDTSRDAAVAAKPTASKQRQAVLDYCRIWHRWGRTQKDVSRDLGIPRASVAARVNELATAGDLVKTTARREGCAVYNVVPR